MSYVPGNPPSDPKLLPLYLSREGARVQEAMEGPRDFVELRVLYAEPTRVRAGMVVYADGATWNPGSGQGLYRRNVANSAWVHLG